MGFPQLYKMCIRDRICSGDAGVYGMAGLMYEVGVNYPETELEIIPGVTAATGGAAVLGLSLIHICQGSDPALQIRNRRHCRCKEKSFRLFSEGLKLSLIHI